ncbi:MAG: 3-hydroxybutyrate dehydrogenase [Planctomycetota bacterium]
MNMKDHRILVTGAGSGLGRGVAHFLGEHGAQIFAVDLNLPGAEQTAQELRAAGGRAQAFRCDVTDPAAVAALVQALPEPPDVLINNAGLQHVVKIEEFPVEKWDLLIAVMVKGPFLLARALLPAMRKNGFGRIVNIGSIHSLVASKYKAAYVTAKHALVGLTKTLALETADSDITVNTICPSYILTPLVEKQIAQQAQMHGLTPAQVTSEIFLKPMPKQAFVGIDEVAALAEFLLGPHAKNITGQTIAIDGGWTAQ